MKGITLCAECTYYDKKKHRCKRGASKERFAIDPFYDDCPLPDVVEVRHGRWVSLTPSLLLEEFREMEADKFFMCSECKGECQLVEQDDYYDYCPRCGCKMDKEE